MSSPMAAPRWSRPAASRARAGLEQAQHEERQGAVAEGGAAGVEQVGQAKPTGEAEGGGDMAGGTGLEDLEGVGGGADDDAALEEEGDLVDERGRGAWRCSRGWT